MEVLKALLSIIVGVMFFSVLFMLAKPLLLFVLILIIIGIIRIAIARWKFNKQADVFREQATKNRQSNQYQSSQQKQNVSGDVIDAEFTEEEIVD